MSYYIDLEKVSLKAYGKKLEKAYLPPSRLVLREQREERFACFEQMGIKNLKDLIQLLKKKDNWRSLLAHDCFSEDYLKILLRELNSILPKPNKISDFPRLSANTANTLANAGIKNTLQLYTKILTPDSRRLLASQLNLVENEIYELAKLCDLSRIKWVGVTFARMLYDLGFDTVEKAAKANAEKLHILLNNNNEENAYYKGKIGLNDVRIFIDAAKEVPIEIEF